jgi:hypothetical protein
MKQNQSFLLLIFVAIFGVGAALAYSRSGTGVNPTAIGIVVSAFVLAAVVSKSIQVADQWDKAVILRLGHFHSLKGPGLFFIIPVIDAIPSWIDTRVITTDEFYLERGSEPGHDTADWLRAETELTGRGPGAPSAFAMRITR